MMKPPSRALEITSAVGGPVFHGSMIQLVPVERIVSPVLVVVEHIVSNQAPQMTFIQRDDLIEDLAATASHPAFRNPVLPRGLNTGWRPAEFRKAIPSPSNFGSWSRIR
jgi:hypothetical protein